MSGFSSKFPEGFLAREIALLGLSQEEFAREADVDPATITRANRGLRLRPKSWGRIKRTLEVLKGHSAAASA